MQFKVLGVLEKTAMCVYTGGGGEHGREDVVHCNLLKSLVL